MTPIPEVPSAHPRTPAFSGPLGAPRTAGFTLIELLVVISIIAILAALIFPVTGAVKKRQTLKRAQAELAKIETAIEAYQTKNGYYPPSDTNSLAPNSLFFELMGCNLANNFYTTLDGAATIQAPAVPATFGPAVGGVMNCTRGGGDEGGEAKKFLESARAGTFLDVTNGNTTVLGVPIDGPPSLVFGNDRGRINPWRYNSARPVYNRKSFDLWVDVKTGREFYRVSNWGRPQAVKLLPADGFGKFYWP